MRVALLFSVLLAGFVVYGQQAPVLNIIPKPEKVTITEGVCPIDRERVIDMRYAPELQALKRLVAEEIGATLDSTGRSFGRPLDIGFILSENEAPREAYGIEVNTDAITIIASSEEGLFRGSRTLVQLLGNKPIGAPLPCMRIGDRPRFAWRGMHLDVSRHFFPVEFVKKYIDLIAYYKMNTFHWHLTDDQGWRIEIKKYPKLTEVGAWRSGSQYGPYSQRTYDSIPYGGFYTQEQIREVVAYAQQRHITVVPEIEMPGHSMAALAAYPELSCTGGPFVVSKGWGVLEDVFCTKDSTFQFMENVLSEVIDLFPSKYIHIGGDECPKERWKVCPVCQARMKTEGLKDEHELQSYFIRRIEKFVNSKGRKVIGWDEILEGGLAPNAAVMSWRGTEGGVAAAKEKHNVVMSPGTHCYFDHYQGDPIAEPLAIGGFTTLQKVYSYEPVPAELTEEEAKYIMGAQANLWAEYITTTDHMEYMAMPRMAALAEVLWSPKESRNEKDFITRLEKSFPQLDAMNVHYSKSLYNVLFKLSGSKSRGQVNMDLQFDPSFGEVRYTLDGTDPTATSPLYSYTLEITANTEVRAALFRGEQRWGSVTSRTITFDKGTGRKITVQPAPSDRYNDGGPFALVNGVSAGLRRVNTEWLGWQGREITITVDLGTPQALTHLGIGSLEERYAWIHLPREVTISTSDDGTAFNTLVTRTPAADAAGRTEFFVEQAVTTRFVRFVVKGHGTIEEGWAGAGGNAWTFLDEIHLR